MGLARVHVDVMRYDGGRHPTERHEVTGHPEPPDAPAVAALRRRVLDQRATATDPTVWWHRDGNTWAAVTDLHRAGDHDRAHVLAVFLHWCDQWPWNQVSYWQLDVKVSPPNPSRTAGTSRDSSETFGQLELGDAA